VRTGNSSYRHLTMRQQPFLLFRKACLLQTKIQKFLTAKKLRKKKLKIGSDAFSALLGMCSFAALAMDVRLCLCLKFMEHLRRSNTFRTPPPHVRRGRTWGYRGATSATWQTTLRNLSFACVFPLRRGKLRALTFLYLGECKGENLAEVSFL
jgi:hypothetical protein